MQETVFINRILNMKKIKAIGFDMDHTLVRYNIENFERLAHSTIIKKLISDKSYPRQIETLKFDFNLAIRGLVIDKKNGNILKVNHFERIKDSFHGTKRIDFKQQTKIYKGTVVDLNDENYKSIDTAFDIAFVILFAQLVDLKDQYPTNTYPEYHQMADDVVEVLDIAHQDGTLKNEVRKNRSEYILRDEITVRVLEKLMLYGKKLFLLTNSDYEYTKLLLDYAINPYLTQCKTWEELFSVSIVASQKPGFFYSNQNFLKVDPETGALTTYYGEIANGIFYGGCSKIFQKSLALDGQDILYIGDHIFGDILRLKKECDWRTALVIEELASEIAHSTVGQTYLDTIAQLMTEKSELEKVMNAYHADKIERSEVISRTTIDMLIKKMTTIDSQIGDNIKAYNKNFNPNWGEIMRSGNDPSRYAKQAERYACIYMSTIADLINYSPRYYFRPLRRPLPHETVKNSFISEVDVSNVDTNDMD